MKCSFVIWSLHTILNVLVFPGSLTMESILGELLFWCCVISCFISSSVCEVTLSSTNLMTRVCCARMVLGSFGVRKSGVKWCFPATILSMCSVMSVLMRKPLLILVSEVMETWISLNRICSTCCFVAALLLRVYY